LLLLTSHAAKPSHPASAAWHKSAKAMSTCRFLVMLAAVSCLQQEEPYAHCNAHV